MISRPRIANDAQTEPDGDSLSSLPDASLSLANIVIVRRPFSHFQANLSFATDLASVDEPALCARPDDVCGASQTLLLEVGRLLVEAPLASRNALIGRWALLLGCRWPAARLPRALASRLLEKMRGEDDGLRDGSVMKGGRPWCLCLRRHRCLRRRPHGPTRFSLK